MSTEQIIKKESLEIGLTGAAMYSDCSGRISVKKKTVNQYPKKQIVDKYRTPKENKFANNRK